MTDTVNYNILQKKVDELIAKHGTNAAYHIIDSALKQEHVPYGKDVALVHFIINTCCDEFGVSTKHLFNKNAEDKRARWSVFYLTIKYTELALKDVAWRFDLKSVSPVRYGRRQVADLLEQPKVDKEHHRVHMQAQGKIETFIQKVNHGKGI